MAYFENLKPDERDEKNSVENGWKRYKLLGPVMLLVSTEFGWLAWLKYFVLFPESSKLIWMKEIGTLVNHFIRKLLEARISIALDTVAAQ